MDNLILTYKDVEIRVTFLSIYDNKVYVVLKYSNIGKSQRHLYYREFGQYFSKKLGIKNFLGKIPAPDGYSTYSIREGYFLENQIAYDCPEINKGDNFSIEISIGEYSTSSIASGACLLYFSYSKDSWTVTVSGREVDLNIVPLAFKKQEESGPKAIENPMEVLSSLIGLASVKDEVRTLANFIKIQKMREKKKLPTSEVSYHCVLTGNPGTGKTTVARILASIYKELGVLKKGHMVETDRSGLVAGYVGQTAIKTNAVIDSALDGVLFIDEAYSLCTFDAQHDFGSEALATLLKRMEDNRDRLVVIVAGYTKEMREFIDSNSGLKSRFLRYIEFPDYTPEELLEIFELNVKNGGYVIDSPCKELLLTAFKDAVSSGDRNYGNGRFARNLFEETLKAQANRLVGLTKIKMSDLTRICSDDIQKGIETIHSGLS